MAATLQVTRTPEGVTRPHVVRKYSCAWTSHTDGSVSLPMDINGQIMKVVTNPVDGPTDNYDLSLLDADGLDVFEGYGSNRDTTNTEEFVPYIKEVITASVQSALSPVVVAGDHTFTIANAGDTKSGVCIIYVR